MAGGIQSSHGYKPQWISTALLIVTIILTRKISLAKYCPLCTDCYSLEVQGECFCKETTLFKIEKIWNNWYGRYDIKQTVKQYSFLICENMRQDSFISYENDCKYLTFRKSDIEVLRVNSFIEVPLIQEIYLNSSGILQIRLGAFSGISKLQILHLEDNKIDQITKGYLNSLVSLKVLDLHQNAINLIENESFIGLTMLEKLDLSQNALVNIPLEMFDPLENLKILNLSHNHLAIIDFKLIQLQTLDTLDLSNNRIEILEQCFNGSNLISIYLQENQISFLNDSCFPTSLATLYVQNNNLTELDTGVLEDLTDLKNLDFSHNQISKISLELFKDCERLQKLDMSHNEIDHLKTGVFSGVPELTFLNISYIKIKTLDPHVLFPLTELKIFDFDNNDLDNLDSSIFHHFTRLEEIYISGNHFSCAVIASIISQSKIKGFSVIYDKDYTTENVNGLPCKKKNDTEAVSSIHNSVDRNKENSFNEDWKMRQKEILENISSKVHKDVKELMDAEKVFFNNSLNEFSDKQEVMLQEYQVMLETERLNMKKIIDFLYSNRSAIGNVESNLVNSKSIHTNIEKHFSVQNTKIEDSFMKFSKNLEKFIEKSVPNIENSAINSFKNIFNSTNSSTSMLNGNLESDDKNSTTNNQIKHLSSTINQLKMILIIICSICIFLYVVEKISVICWKRFREDKESFDIIQEIPMLRNY